MRIVGVVDDQWAAKSVAILQLMVGVVPVGARLILSVEPVLKTLARLNRTLSDESNAVSPVGSVLEDPVPMLKNPVRQRPETKQTSHELTIVVVCSMVGSRRLLMTLIEKSRPYYPVRHNQRLLNERRSDKPSAP